MPALPALEVTDLHKHYGEHAILQGIDLTAHDGDVISIIGSSGSGKSTLLRCLNLLEHPSQGSICLRGKELQLVPDGRDGLQAASHRQLERLRARMGFVFQNFNLWPHMTILDNVMLAPRRVHGLSAAEARERAEALLDRVGLADKRHAWPANLSGGQQQRVAIARTLAMEPELILFDEPTSALDPELVNDVLAVMRSLAEEGRTMLVVTHEMRFAREVSTHVMFLHAGRVAEFGPPAQVFGAPTSERCREFLASHLQTGTP